MTNEKFVLLGFVFLLVCVFLIDGVFAAECSCITINERGGAANPLWNNGNECSPVGSGKIGVCDSIGNCRCVGEGEKVVGVGRTEWGWGGYIDSAKFFDDCVTAKKFGWQMSGVSYNGYPFEIEARCVYQTILPAEDYFDDSKSYTKYYPDLTKENYYYVDGFIGGDGAYCIQWTEENKGTTNAIWREQNGFTQDGKCISPVTHISYERIIGGGNKAYQIKEDDSDRTYLGIVTYKDNGPAPKIYNTQVTVNGEKPARFNNPVSGGLSYYSFYPDCNTLYSKEPAQKNTENTKVTYKYPIKSVCDLNLIMNNEFKSTGLCGLNSVNSQGANCSDVISLPKTSNDYTVGCPEENKNQTCYKVPGGLASPVRGTCQSVLWEMKCVTVLQTCEEACQSYQPSGIKKLVDGPKLTQEDIKWECTNGFDFDENEGDRRKFIDENLPEGISDELVWNPGKDSNEPNTQANGEDYCRKKYETFLDMDFGKTRDCVCWAEPPCPDKDGDGYGAVKEDGDYLFMCPNKEEDCWDNPEVFPDFTKSKLYQKLDKTNSIFSSTTQAEKLLKAYKDAMGGYVKRTTVTGDGDGNLADEINPGKVESIRLYYDLFIDDGRDFVEGTKEVMDWISACDDGVDNDCDTFVDCFDAGCASSILPGMAGLGFIDPCKDTCGKACVDKYPATSGAVCLKKEDFNPFSKSNRLIEGIEECTKKQEVCVCELSGCEALCVNKKEEVNAQTKKEKYTSYKSFFGKIYNLPSERETENKVCYYNANPKISNVNQIYYEGSGDGKDCCCNICEKTDALILAPEKSSIGYRLINYFTKTTITPKVMERIKDEKLYKSKLEGGIEEWFLNLFVGDVSDNPLIYETIMNDVLNSDEDDKRILRAFFCDEVADYLIKRDKEASIDNGKYGLYSSAIITLVIQDAFLKGKARKIGEQDILGITELGGPLSKVFTIPIIEFDPDYEKEYGFIFREMIKRAIKFNSAEIATKIGEYNNYVEFSKGCKLCWPVPKEAGEPQRKGHYSYFSFSDMLDGFMQGEAYSIEPHGFAFSKDFEFRYNNFAQTFEFSKEDFENCSVEDISESTVFTISPEAINFSYENMSFSFPEEAVLEPMDTTITKVYFNCSEEYERRYLEYEKSQLPEQVALLEMMKSVKSWISGEYAIDYLKKIIGIWRG